MQYSIVLAACAAFAATTLATAAAAQAAADADADARRIEEVVVTGTHIRGATIGGVLPVSVIDADEIERLGVDSGDELLDALPEQGQNFFNEAENISGGVNSARGDIGAFNLRNLGTGNTLVLLNGRRMVNAASYQTEEVGGSFVPVNTVNANTLPVYGTDRIEILKDGASAIYGADAVAGVVNTVLKTDHEGLLLRTRYGWYEHLERAPLNIDFAWGSTLGGGRTNISLMGSYQTRDRVRASEDGRWADADLRRLIPDDSPWSGSTAFRNTSANSLFGQFDLVDSASGAGVSGTLTDSSGEFEVFPVGHEDCDWALNARLCGAPDGAGVLRYNLNEFRDLSAELDRWSLFAFVNHAFDNGVESFTELMYYASDTNLRRHPSAPFSSVKLRVGARNHYNPFGPCDSPNRLTADVIPDVPCSGLELEIDNYRFAEVPRIVDNDGAVYRLLHGLRGSAADWDWEGAALYSRATRTDRTRNRVSNTRITEALFDPTPAAYNPFSGGVDSNIERALVDVRRDNAMDLLLIDFKMSRSDLLALPAGPMGLLAGAEYRRESFEDDRDARLDGTIAFTDFDGDTFPLVSDVVNSSPTPDNSGERSVVSLFGEVQIPVADGLDAQLALRYENFSDVGDTLVGKVAAGWRPHDAVLLRGSWSQAFRAPNLVTVNETLVARQNTRTDYACLYAADNGGDPGQDSVDCRNSVQRTARGSRELAAEESDNYSFGIVIEPNDSVTATVDYWTIEKSDTIGLFGEENHTVLDLLARLAHGGGNCAAFAGNPALVRAADIEADAAAVYRAAGICPAGDVLRIDDRYANLDTRTLSGFDVGIRISLRTALGDVRFKYAASFLREFEQTAGGAAAELVAAKDAGILPASIPVQGFDDLVERNGNQKRKDSLSLGWRNGAWGASISGTRIGEVYQESLTLDDGMRYYLGAMATLNAAFDYRRSMGDFDARMRLGVRNATDERAPLADRYFGYFADVHGDFGRSLYVDVRLTRE